MPGLRVSRGWCGCFGKEEPPEITYCVVGQGGTLGIHPLTPTQPMPPEDELNAKFSELVDELDLTAQNRQAMLMLPSQKKWQIYCSRKGKEEDRESSALDTPENYVEKLNAMAMLHFSPDEEVVRSRARDIESLKTALRTQPNSFVIKFIELEGLAAILNFLSNMDWETGQSSIHTSIIGCLKALMNNSSGRAHVLAHPSSINIIAQSLSTNNMKTEVMVLEILGAVCLVPGGHRKVLAAMLHYQEFAGERTRFQTVVNELDCRKGKYQDEVAVKTAVMSFINAVLNYGPGQENLEFRVHLRYEFLMLGIQPIIDKLRKHENSTLDRHLDFFEMVRNEDEKELAKRFEQVHIDTKSAGSMFEILRKKLAHSAAYPHLLSLLHHCLLLPLDLGTCPHHWLLFDRLVQQVILQSESGHDLDIGPVEINVKELVHLLADEEEMTKLRQQAEEMEKENLDISSRLAKKEQECEELSQEKEDLDTSMARLKEKLEKETLLNLEAQQKLSEAEYNLSQMSKGGVVMNGSLPDDAKIGLKGSPFKSSVIPPPPSLPGAPPPPPPPGPPPPPSAPRPPNAPPHPSRTQPKKNIPQPSNPLKSFNWSKLPESKLDGTVWNELDDTKLFKHMDLGEVDKLFSAYQRNGADRVDGSAEDIRTLGRSKSKVLSIIDSRRAQNCTILLSKLKLSNQEIFKALHSMDRDDVLPPDMVEQLLKFVPSSEECALLEEHSGELNQMARADRFLYDLSRIPHFEQRLRTLFYKKRFPERVSEVQPRITGVLEASKETQRSKKLKKILELVLAFGNYMNRGQRGNAVGFKLPSLNRLGDTKSSTNKNLTLLHYLLETINKKFKDLLKIEEDLPSIRMAAKVSMSELEKDMAALRSGLKEVEKELDFQRGTASSTTDQYLPVMKAFHQQATLQFNQLDDLFQDMKQRYERAVRLFGEDPAIMQPDEFFGIFDNFLSSFQEAYQDNDNQRRRLEEEERRRKQEEELKRRTLEKKNSRRDNPNGICNGSVTKVSRIGVQEKDKGEFDDLISALRTGDVFGDDIAKFKRNRKRISGTGGSPPRITNCTSLRDNSRERVLANGKA